MSDGHRRHSFEPINECRSCGHQRDEHEDGDYWGRLARMALCRKGPDGRYLLPARPRCVKCGSTDIHTRWDPSILECGWSERERRYGREVEFSGEHLHRHCRGCAYEWGEAIANATDPA